jgi:chromosome segregation ATPase
MNRFLEKFNLVGIILLAALCAIQWRVNRDANVEAAQLRKTQLEQSAQIAEHKKTIAGQTIDLESFRTELMATKGAEKELAGKLSEAERANRQLVVETEQLKATLTNWVAAIAERDEQLRRASTNIQELIVARDDVIEKYNGLVKQHNQLVAQVNRPATNSEPKN